MRVNYVYILYIIQHIFVCLCPKGPCLTHTQNIECRGIGLIVKSLIQTNISILSWPNLGCTVFYVCTAEQVLSLSMRCLEGSAAFSRRPMLVTLIVSFCVFIWLYIKNVQYASILYILCLHALEFLTAFQCFKTCCTHRLLHPPLHYACQLPVLQGYSEYY